MVLPPRKRIIRLRLGNSCIATSKRMQQNMLMEETECIGRMNTQCDNKERVKQKSITTGQKNRRTWPEEEPGLETSALKQAMMVPHCLAKVIAKCLMDTKDFSLTSIAEVDWFSWTFGTQVHGEKERFIVMIIFSCSLPWWSPSKQRASLQPWWPWRNGRLLLHSCTKAGFALGQLLVAAMEARNVISGGY